MTKALANRRRLMIIKYLQGTKSASVGAIAEKIDLSFKATSKHLGILHANDIVEREQISLTMKYRLAHPTHNITKSILSNL